MKRNKFTSMNLEKGRMNFLVKFIAWLMKMANEKAVLLHILEG
jgi:hypothetical protein